MSIAAGSLKHRIEIQAAAEQRNSAGAVTYVWTKIANGDDWARIRPLSVRSFIAAAAAQSKVSVEIAIRYRPDVNAKMRVVCGSQIYNIEGVLPDADSGREYLTFAASLGVNLGA